MLELLKPYVLYVSFYLGVALTGGSVVHLPMDPPRYLLIGAIGIAIFIAASVADVRRRQAERSEAPVGGLGRYVGWSVVLSLGLGMLSGGIQHFLDFPHYAAALLPLGVALSLAAYLARENKVPAQPTLRRLAGATLVVVVALHLGLDHLAHDLAHNLDGHAH